MNDKDTTIPNYAAISATFDELYEKTEQFHRESINRLTQALIALCDSDESIKAEIREKGLPDVLYVPPHLFPPFQQYFGTYINVWEFIDKDSGSITMHWSKHITKEMRDKRRPSHSYLTIPQQHDLIMDMEKPMIDPFSISEPLGIRFTSPIPPITPIHHVD